MKQSLWNIIKFKNFENEKSNLTEFLKRIAWKKLERKKKENKRK